MAHLLVLEEGPVGGKAADERPPGVPQEGPHTGPAGGIQHGEAAQGAAVPQLRLPLTRDKAQRGPGAAERRLPGG
eukprot:11175466-Lingulodinium_polyedra.AAC.1